LGDLRAAGVVEKYRRALEGGEFGADCGKIERHRDSSDLV